MNINYLDYFNYKVNRLSRDNLKRNLKVVTGESGVRTIVNGEEKLLFCSNDYLGLANNPQIKEYLIEGIRKLGAGSGASHLISGHHDAHSELESKLAATQKQFFLKPKALFFSNGYMANLAVITSLTADSKKDNFTVFSEELNHASLIDGVKLAQQQNKSTVLVYGHLDLDELESQLASHPKSFKLIVTDGVFSMDGDIAPIPSMLDLAEKYDALLIVDDAHGFGVIGPNGLGILDHFQIEKGKLATERLIYIGTLGKAAGICGAFAVASPKIIEWIIQKGRSYIYTTASPPFIAYALSKSVGLITENKLQKTLKENILYFKTKLDQEKWKPVTSETAIQPLLVGKALKTLKIGNQLYDNGIWVPAIRPPTVPEGTSRLRLTFSAAHKRQHIDKLIKTLDGIENE